MSGRPVQILVAAAFAVVAGTAMTTAASANCFSCGASYSYAAPVAIYQPPVVYSTTYSAPVSYGYASGCNPCGGYGFSYGQSYGYAVAPTPSYVVNQGPTYTEPVTIGVLPTQSYDYGHRRAYPYIGGAGVRWQHHGWSRGYGYRYRHSYGYRQSFGYRGAWGHRHHAMRYGIQAPGYRGGWQGPRYRTGFIAPQPRWAGRAVPPRHWHVGMGPRPHMSGMGPHRMGGMPHRAGGGQMHIMRQPGSVSPR